MAELEIKPTAGMRMRVYLLIVAAAITTLVLCWLLAGSGANLFIPRATVYTDLPDATGLAPESDVRLDGLHVGDISKIEISPVPDPQHAVRVVMRIQRSYLKNIPADSMTAVDEDTIVGDQFLSIAAGKNSTPIRDHGTLPSAPLKQAAVQADLLASLSQELTQVDEALIVMSSGQTKLGRLMMGTKEYTDTVAKISSFERTMAAFAAPESPLGRAIYSTDAYDRVHNAALRADRMLADMQAGQGALGHFVVSDDQYNSFLRQLGQLRSTLADINAGKGAYASLLQNDDDYQKIVQLLASADSLISALTAPGGRAGELLHSSQLYESLNGALENMNKILREIDQHPQKYLRVKVF